MNPVAESVIAGLIGLAIGAVIMLVYGYDPVAAYISLFRGSFGSVYSWAESLANATPLILTALTFAVAMRGGLFNIGAEGQLYIGALAAVAVSLIHLPYPLHVIVALVAWRIQIEERALARQPEHAAYRQAVRWKLLPGLW